MSNGQISGELEYIVDDSANQIVLLGKRELFNTFKIELTELIDNDKQYRVMSNEATFKGAYRVLIGPDDNATYAELDQIIALFFYVDDRAGHFSEIEKIFKEVTARMVAKYKGIRINEKKL